MGSISRTHEVLARTQSSCTETDGQTDTRVASLFVNIATKAHTHTHTQTVPRWWNGIVYDPDILIRLFQVRNWCGLCV